jgi:F0F1-type ATP synthase membrane subunit c/vacuolar-type H+-ATPase subunit K
MMDASRNETIEKKLLVMWIIWGAIVGSLVIYILACHLLGDQIRQHMGPDFPLKLMRNILFGVGIVTLIAIRFIRRFILGKPFGGPGSVSAAPPSSPDQPTVYAKYTTAMIISLALCESIGIYGLVMFFLGDSFQTLYTFIVISAAGMFYYRPKKEEIEALSREY